MRRSAGFFYRQHKRNLWRKLVFACRIMNRYDNVYLLQPNSVNLFSPPYVTLKQTVLSTYTRRWYHGIFYGNGRLALLNTAERRCR